MALTKRQLDQVANHIRRALEIYGVRTSKRPDMKETPMRVAKAWQEALALTSGEEMPFELTTFPSKTDQLVIVKDTYFSSMCEHHLLPFYGHISIGYLPGDRIVGLSKVPRVINWLSRQPCTQEALTECIASFFMTSIKPKGIMVLCEATHTCMTSRGVREPNSKTITHALRGESSLALKDEFLALVRRN